MSETGARWFKGFEHPFLSLVRVSLALTATILLVVAALSLTFDRHAGPVVSAARIVLFPPLAWFAASQVAGVWRARTHVLA